MQHGDRIDNAENRINNHLIPMCLFNADKNTCFKELIWVVNEIKHIELLAEYLGWGMPLINISH